MIKCGHCKGLHPTVAEVRRCATGYASVARSLPGRTFTEADERAMHRMEAEADRRETLEDSRRKAAKWDAEWRSLPGEAKSALRRDLDESDVIADGDRAEFQRQMRNDEPADLQDLLAKVDGMLVTREIPEADHRWSRAVRNMISGKTGRVTEYALRTAIARLETYPMLGGDAFLENTLGAKASAPEPQEEAASVPGLYRLDGELYQVVFNKEGSHLYAKHVILPEGHGRPTLTYAPGILRRLRASDLVPVEEAEEITRRTGWCVFGHFLTNPISIARGMGPKCWAKYGAAYAAEAKAAA